MRISVTSSDSDAAMPLSGTRGRAMTMKDTRAESTTGSSLASEASRTKMATTKYAGGMRGRHFATRLERRVAVQWHDVVGVAVYEVLWHNSP
ncbi:hypothetical protein GYH30_017324 [Glycine max]|nr:hypothetical protein GYH30_017324 [Glycine max]